eukprot:gene1430-828_t
MSRFLEIEISKLKNLPQTDDDVFPCSSQVRFCLWNDEMTEAVSTEQNSSVQEKSNAPFFKENLLVPLDDERETGVLFFTVWEHSRRDEPFIMFYGRQEVSYEKHKKRKDLTIVLTTQNPAEQPEAALKEEEQIRSGDVDKAPTLFIRVLMPKRKELEQDKYADVLITPESAVVLSGKRQLLPERSHFVWMHLLLDKKFIDNYRKKLLADWQGRPPLEGSDAPVPKRKKSLGNQRASSVGKKPTGDGESKELKSIADVIVKRWCCHRPHQVLNRLRLTAEKFLDEAEELTFTPEEELAYRTQKKERAILISRMCIDSLQKTGANNLRDWLERLWVLYTVGVDNDPAGSRALSYDLRKKVMESTFDVEDSIVLQASLLNQFIPALSYERCQAMAEDDARNSPDFIIDQPEGWEQKITVHQRYFTKILSEFMGSLMDTLTEAELLRFCKAMKPAVFDAQQRVLKNAKSGILNRVRPEGGKAAGDPFSMKGDGIKIDHLDKYGNRIRTTQFA